MAKTTGPLLSFDASGTTGKVMTASKWKGRTYMRLRVIPKNVKTNNTAGPRYSIGVSSKIIKQIRKTGALYAQILPFVPVDQSWASFFVSTIIGKNDQYISAAVDAYSDPGNATVAAYFDAEAPNEGLSGFQLPYGPIGFIPPGAQLWIAADAAFRLGLACAPATPADMNNTQVQAFGAAFAA